MKQEWIVVANAARARVFGRETSWGELEELQSFVHDASRLKVRELAHDRAGHHDTDSGRGGTSYQARVDPHQRERLHFAHEIAHEVDAAFADGRCGRLVICASSPFLGELKAHLGASATKGLHAVHDLDLTTFDAGEIRRRLQAPAAR